MEEAVARLPVVNGRAALCRGRGRDGARPSRGFATSTEATASLRPEWECGLPGYLQHDLDAFKAGRASGSSLMDCLWGELYGSINGAEIDDQAITHEHAEYLRDTYLRKPLA